ncbi:MAG: ATP-binding cassette domain-containing protein [Phycisphaeraceae bacterium]|nr:ATP-binding cassette domain-containing protein [Phycisphaeraceae bacterium]
MSMPAATPIWDDVRSGSGPVPASPLPVLRDGVLLFGVTIGTVSVLVRAVGEDGRLRASETVVSVGEGQLLAVPPDSPGLLFELRASHDARVEALDSLRSEAVPQGRLQNAVRPYFAGGSKLDDWCASLEPDLDWSTFTTLLGDLLTSHAGEAVESATQRLRERIQRLRSLDDESLSEAVRIMTSAESTAGPVAAGDARTSNDERAILKVLEATGAVGHDPDAVADLGDVPGVGTVDHVARRLHLKYREVRLDGEWWREGAGPLFTRRVEDGVPVALLPKGGGYVAFEHGNDGVRCVDPVRRSTAGAYEDTATMFYRPLPRRAGRIRDLLGLLVAGNLRDVLMILGTTIAISMLIALVPILTGMIVGTVIPTYERVQLLFIGAMLVSIALSQALVHVVAGIAFLRIETRSSYQVIASIVDRVLQLPSSFFRNTSAGDLTQRVMAIETVRSALTQSTLSVVVSLTASLSNIGVLFYYDAEMALTAFGVIVVELAIVIWVSIRMAKLDYGLSVAQGELDGLGIDMLVGIRQIRIQGSRDRVLARLLARLGRVGGFSFRSGVMGVWLGVVVGTASTLAMALVFVEFTANVRGGSGTVLTDGGFVAFITAMSAFLAAVIGVAPAIRAVAGMVPQIHRIRPILEAETEVGETAGDSITLKGGVAARGIRFRYDPDQPPILDGVDIEAGPGEFIAIVGRTGCGKSTLLSVLLGLEKPEAGQVFYDDLPMESLDAAMVRSQVGVVMQSNEVLSGNVQSTILGVGSQRTLDDAWAAARLVGMADEIDAMPMGMLTMITPTSLSQSQLQRLLIARSIVSRPELLLLDEATSSLDNASQERITRSIDGLGATRIVIAHRLSTIRRADRIYVLEKGRVVQSGTYAELEGRDGPFHDLMAGQAS